VHLTFVAANAALAGGRMQSVVGVFDSRTAAQQAIETLVSRGVDRDSLTFASMQLSTSAESFDRELTTIPTTDAEADGMGASVGAVVGGGIGASAGLAGGAAVASLLVPGVGTIFAIGLGAAALLGMGGAAVGATAGKAAEHALDIGVPRDDLRLYRDLLQRGRSLVIASVESDDQASVVKEVLRAQGAEDIDDARGELGRTA
jgi:hypothetical protein